MNSEEKIIKRLRNSAITYLSRYEVSEFQFKSTMKRKLSYFENNLNESEKDKLINQIKSEMVLSRFIDDDRYAETKIRTIRRQGGSKRLIFAKLNEKGISKDVIQSALNIVDENQENAEIIAAVNFIKKKKIGVFYKNPKINDEIDTYTLKDKWYGSLARRGFSLEIVKKVLDIEDINDAHLILEGNVL
jgi:regulatory protein